MKKNNLVRWPNILVIVFFIVSIFASSSTCKISINKSSNGKPIYYYNEGYGFEHFNKYNASEIAPEDWEFYLAHSINNKLTNLEEKRFIIAGSLFNTKPIGSLGCSGLIDSAWPMYCHDTRHTGRSPYSTADNVGFEKWQFAIDGSALGSPVIDDQGVIYIGTREIYAVYPNNTLKWKYDVPYHIESAPAIDEFGVLYAGTVWAHPNYLNAIYTSNSTLKWKYQTGDDVYSSPAIGNDGIIYFCDSGNWQIKALYPNGTLKWSFQTNYVVYSSPAIADDGTIYCGSHDTYLYALYPDNGTLKWRYKTGNWIRTSPCIGDDGTIYVVSLDNYLHAVNPDGTQKWITYMGEGGTSPTIGQDGTIYAGYRTLRAVDPTNGSVKWTFDVGGTMRGGTPCNSVDGTIYVGTSDGGELIAINPNGTLKWRKSIGTCESAPAIGNDGTVYIGAGGDDGYLFAFGYPDPNAPNTPTINGPIKGIVRTYYNYTFSSIDPNGDDVFYYITWGDGTSDGWIGPYDSGKVVIVSHSWSKKGTYLIQAQARDTNNLKSDWGKLTVTMPKNKVINFNSLLLKLLEQFPLLQRLSYFLK